MGHEVQCVAFSLDMGSAAGTLRRLAPDVVFNLVESVGGSARLAHLAPALLEHLGLIFTGSGSQAMYLTTGKILAKQMLALRDLPTPSWRNESSTDPEPGRTFIIKSVWEHASLGLDDEAVISYPKSGALAASIAGRAVEYGGEWFAEEFIWGREFSVAMLGNGDGFQVLHPAEILFRGFGAKPAVVGYKAKWDVESPEYEGTPRTFLFPDSDSFLLESLRRMTAQCIRLFGLAGYARVDFRVDQEGRPYIIDINANPCIAPDAGFAAALEHSDIEYSDAIDSIVKNAISGARCLRRSRAA
jgi:D-alanine-D-alanine ligase